MPHLTPGMLAFLLLVSLWDGFDVVAMSQTLPELRNTFALSVVDGGQLVGLANCGTVLGYFVLRSADTVGRRPVLLGSVFGYSLLSILSGLSPSAGLFLLSQMAARIFLVSTLGAASLYVSESLPAEKTRGTLSLLVAAGSFGGVVCALLAPKLIATQLGWRSVYLFGGLMLVLLPVGLVRLPETPSFLTLKNRVAPSLTSIWKAGYGRKLVLCSLLWLFTYAVNQSAITFWKEHAMADLAFSAQRAGMYMGLAALVAIPTSALVGRLLNRIGLLWGCTLVYALWSLGILGSYLLSAGLLLRLSLSLLTCGASAGLIISITYTTELFPTEQRGDALAWSNSLLGRIGFIGSPLLMSALANTWGWVHTMPYLATLPACALLVLWFLPDRRVTKEEYKRPGSHPSSP